MYAEQNIWNVWNVEVLPDIGKTHQYKRCYFDKYQHDKETCRGMTIDSNITTENSRLRFGEKLTQAVANKLMELGLLRRNNERPK